jgi:GTP-binding protein LepA
MVLLNLPLDTEDYEERNSMEKLQLNDASLVFLPESSAALDLVSVVDFRNAAHGDYSRTSRREFNMTVITTVPNVSYHVYKKDPDTVLIVNNPSDLPEPSRLDHVEEPFIKATIITKSDVGNVMSLCIEKRGITIKPI